MFIPEQLDYLTSKQSHNLCFKQTSSPPYDCAIYLFSSLNERASPSIKNGVEGGQILQFTRVDGVAMQIPVSVVNLPWSSVAGMFANASVRTSI